MCGRYASFRNAQALEDEFNIMRVIDEARERPASWNIAPTLDIRVVLERMPRGQDTAITRQLRLAHWGLVPHWARDKKLGVKLINARSETLDEKPSFRSSVKTQRCIIPADGWYEWQTTVDGDKQPWYFQSPNNDVLAFAGLYSIWRDPTKSDDDPQRWLLSATIITEDAADEHGHVHPRQPVLLSPDLYDSWLDPRHTDSDEAMDLLRSSSIRVESYPVASTVNRVSNDGPELISRYNDSQSRGS